MDVLYPNIPLRMLPIMIGFSLIGALLAGACGVLLGSRLWIAAPVAVQMIARMQKEAKR